MPVRAATLIAPGELEVREYPLPDELEPGAVLLRMLASGICGTDKHTFRGETEQYAATEYARSTPFPIIQGHENVGIVERVLMGVAGEDLLTYEGTLTLLDRHQAAIPFASIVSHRFEISRAAEAMAVALDADASAKVLIEP